MWCYDRCAFWDVLERERRRGKRRGEEIIFFWCTHVLTLQCSSTMFSAEDFNQGKCRFWAQQWHAVLLVVGFCSCANFRNVIYCVVKNKIWHLHQAKSVSYKGEGCLLFWHSGVVQRALSFLLVLSFLCKHHGWRYAFLASYFLFAGVLTHLNALDEGNSLLVVIMDTNPFVWGQRSLGTQDTNNNNAPTKGICPCLYNFAHTHTQTLHTDTRKNTTHTHTHTLTPTDTFSLLHCTCRAHT